MPRLQRLLALVVPAAAATADDPVCGKDWREVLRWRSGLTRVAHFDRGAPELLLEKELPSILRPPVNVLSESDYEHMRLKFRKPKRLQQPHAAPGARHKLLLELRNGWLFPSGFAANATHSFQLTALNEINCVQSHLARVVGRRKCGTTDWSQMLLFRHAGRVKSAKDPAWLTEGIEPYNFQCEDLSSVISLIDTQFSDYGHFHESILPRLLWPEVQELKGSTVLWRPRSEGYIEPWLSLLNLSWRSYESVRRPDIVFRFERLYLPLVAGLDASFSELAEITAHTPAEDLLRLRQAVLAAAPAAESSSQLLILAERSPTDRRALSGADAVRLRRAAMELARGAALELLILRGLSGGFETSEVNKRGEVGKWRPMSLKEGLGAFGRAKALLGVHGSLMMHAFLMPKNAQIVDVQARHTYDLPLYHMAAVLGLGYWYHPVEGKHSAETLPLDAPRLERLLAKVAARLKQDAKTEL